jgi:hypothetical protein
MAKPVFSLEPEIEALRPRLGDARANALIARERREVFSIHPELRIAGWLGATMLAAAAGVLLKNNLDRIGPLALAIGIGIAALACYAWTWLRRSRATLADDYVLLLGALLVSADVAFIEAQFHVFGDAWRRHLLLLAILHAAGAYAYRSRVLLTLAITALGGYLGFDKEAGFDDVTIPAFEFAALLIAWRAVDRAARPQTTFSRTFEHFAANAAFLGCLALLDDHIYFIGLLIIALAAVVIFWGFRTRHEPFVLYGFVYAVIAADAMLLKDVNSIEPAAVIVFISMIVAITGLLFLHARFKEAR